MDAYGSYLNRMEHSAFKIWYCLYTTYLIPGSASMIRAFTEMEEASGQTAKPPGLSNGADVSCRDLCQALASAFHDFPCFHRRDACNRG